MKKKQDQTEDTEEDKEQELPKKVIPRNVRSENELLALFYLIYLETNNYLTSD